MSFQTYYLFQLQVSYTVLLFIFFGTLSSYNFHWYLTPESIRPEERQLQPPISKNIHLVLFTTGILGAAICFILLRQHWLLIGISAALTFLYSAPKMDYPPFRSLKKFAIGKTIFLAFAWTHVTVLLPILVNASELTGEHLLFAINRFLIIYAICILFDYRDRDEDRKAGIKSMITYFNEKGIDRLFWASILLFTITIGLMRFFSFAEVVALLLPAIILSFLYYPSKKDFSDYRYYFILDGLMMLSAPLAVLAKFAR